MALHGNEQTAVLVVDSPHGVATASDAPWGAARSSSTPVLIHDLPRAARVSLAPVRACEHRIVGRARPTGRAVVALAPGGKIVAARLRCLRAPSFSRRSSSAPPSDDVPVSDGETDDGCDLQRAGSGLAAGPKREFD